MAPRPSTAPDSNGTTFLGLLRTRTSASPPRGRRQSIIEPPNVHRGSQRIRLVPHMQTPRSYTFSPIVRVLRAGDAPVPIGRFSSPFQNSNHTSTKGKIMFNSQVVSRAHAEVSLDNATGRVMLKCESGSGTFLNRKRVEEGRWVEVRDGDVVQLGVDYQGGVEDKWKAVRMRVEVGREGGGMFDTTALKALEQKVLPDCCICLCAISVRQALFTTPCSHTFHFLCSRPLLFGKTPMFTCPVCRTESNLDEEVDDQESREEKEVLIVEDRPLPPTPVETEEETLSVVEVIQETKEEEEEEERPPSRIPSPPLDWLPEMEFMMSLDSDFAITLNTPGAATSLPIVHTRAPSIPVVRPPSIGRAPTPLLSPTPPSTRTRPTHAASLPPGAALPFNPTATCVSDLPSRTPSPPPPPPSGLGANWLREMELMQCNSQYIVSNAKSNSALGTAGGGGRKGAWNRMPF